MNKSVSSRIAQSSSLSEKQVKQVLQLFSEGATIPFIARYRKEVTGSLDEVQIGQIDELQKQFNQFDARKESILKTLEDQGDLSQELRATIENCVSITELEDAYLPFKKKRVTRASKAKALGLEPLAGAIMKQQSGDVKGLANRFVKGDVKSIDDALQGARDIIAEWISERSAARNSMRKLFQHEAIIESKVIKGKETEGEKFKDYFAYSEPLKRAAGHRILALRRGEDEGFLRASIAPPKEHALERLERYFIRSNNESANQIKLAIKDSYSRLLGSSIETEFRNESKEKADAEAIHIFAENLRQLLLAPPVGGKRTLAIDPGFRTGCKVVCLDENGNLLHNETIFPHPPQREGSKAASKLSQLVKSYKLEVIAIGNGTAGRETEQFIQQQVHLPQGVQAYVVSEAGASIYSASKIAREEFPNYDVTVRGAVSIGRRLMDPLAELVKIDAKSIGVGQYQYDVDQKKLNEKLDQVVISAVNQVGVNVNTASKHLLKYVSGLGPKLAENIVVYRKENGSFASRSELKKVTGLGAKAFEQCAGFLRIPSAKNPLDNTAVHPESYAVIMKMAKDAKLKVKELTQNTEVIEALELSKYISDEIGLPTLEDIKAELKKPGRDPRGKSKVFEFSKDVKTIADLREGLVLPGIVTNLTKFGAFVDVGVKQDGLVHVSQLADRFVSDPTEVVKLHQTVTVKVLEVDTQRNRIAFTMKGI
jgi:uncharacterized protein